MYSAVLCLFFTGAAHLSATAQHKHKKPHAVKKRQVNTVVKEDIDCNNSDTNIIFPELLSGNEEESLDYIEKFSNNRRAYLIRTYNKGKKYFPKAVTILNKHHLPEEYKILLALESAFNANAVSKAGAVGYWQIMDEVAKEYEGRIKVAKLNIDENQNTPPKYGIRGIPTLMLFKNGNVEATKVGALSKSQLTAFIDSNI